MTSVNALLNNPLLLGVILTFVNPYIMQFFKLYLEKLPFVNPHVPDQAIHDISLEISNGLLQLITLTLAHIPTGTLSWHVMPGIVFQAIVQSGLTRMLYQINSKVLTKKAGNDLQNLINQVSKISPELGVALAGVLNPTPSPAPVPASPPVTTAPVASTPVKAAALAPNLAGLTEIAADK